MTQQVMLWDLAREDGPQAEPLPPHNGTATSKAAAESVKEDVGRQEAMILALLAEAGPDGMTDDEIEVATGLRHQSASARRNGLVRKGFVIEARDANGETSKRKTRSNRWAVCWVPTGSGE